MNQVFNNHDQYIELIKQTDRIAEVDHTEEIFVADQHSSSPSIIDEQLRELDTIVLNTSIMEPSAQQNPITPQPQRPNPSLQRSQSVSLTTSINVKNILSYQDVLNAIEREFHLRTGQEREIIMKLWLKGQTMISILQRFRYLLQDLNIDDTDFTEGLKKIRELINYAHRDVHYLREKTSMLENQNRFLDDEFRRQLDKIVQEKNDQINGLIRIIDQASLQSTQIKTSIDHENQPSASEELSKKFLQQNVELQRDLEAFRVKLEHIVTLINTKLDQEKVTSRLSSVSMIQTAFEQMQQTEMKLLELKLHSVSQQEENDLLKYLMEKSQNISDIEHSQLFAIIKQRSLEREIDLVRQELEITEKKTVEFEQKFEHSDETLRFLVETLKLKCDVLRKHIIACSQRLDEMNQLNLLKLQHESQIIKSKTQQEESSVKKRTMEIENELLQLRERYNELAEHSNALQSELTNARKQLNEREKLESSLSTDLEQERRRADVIESEFKSLKVKYEDVCERIRAATHQLDHVQIVLEQTSRRCEQLEKEKSEINAQSEYLTKNVVNVTAKYKDRLSTIKARLEQTDRDKRELLFRNEQCHLDIERLKDELIHQKEVVYEKDKIIQDMQFKNREIVLQRQSIEERISNEHKRLNELIEKNSHLEEELDRFRRIQLSENTIVRHVEISHDSLKHTDELKSQIDEFEQRFIEEKASKESLQVQMKILEEENTDLRDIMSQMRRRSQYGRKEEKDRNDEIHQLIARAELNARQYMTNLNLTSLTSHSNVVKIVPLSSTTKVS
ncbi:unnamed protein product [Rotaria magnacalcarata]|uniref:Uncharacterized protein n=2 Tax=Rotaria magnacalcarata TaxID=392030 RepID=A0A819U4S7_9BILA|nr:unnamed protein product [Rotaria magnacalcarata]CAF1625607.1 unnamed protein product [Rotaria magnacalcarata]CAF2110968.1 unnamed protein product [Rotaria magnacalcarata]CAF4097428.1 unnamed protein product [Rotaria magnacalcarata]